MTSLLELHAVSKRYGGVAAVHQVSFNVRRGQFLGLMGANGAGKTTLFSLIAGNQGVSEGQILFRGESIVGRRPDQICELGVARTFQIVRPFRDMTVLENVSVAALFNARKRPPSQIKHSIERVLELTGLSGVRNSPAGELTLSRQKRLELARALATGGELLLLDEIMAGLTPSEVEEVLVTLKRIQQEFGLTVICVEHVMRALMRLSDEIVVLHHGELIAKGTPQQVADNPDVIRNYFGGA